jgi:hypothetical protein
VQLCVYVYVVLCVSVCVLCCVCVCVVCVYKLMRGGGWGGMWAG